MHLLDIYEDTVSKPQLILIHIFFSYIQVPKDIEEGLLLTLKCFRAARDIYDTVEDQEIIELKDDLLGRYGNALNTTATLYIRKATVFLEGMIKL